MIKNLRKVTIVTIVILNWKIHVKKLVNVTLIITNPANICLLIFRKIKTRKRCEVCSKLIIKTQERRHWCCSGVFIVNFKHFIHFSSVSILDFKQVNVSWVNVKLKICSASQWTGFYMITASIMKELNLLSSYCAQTSSHRPVFLQILRQDLILLFLFFSFKILIIHSKIRSFFLRLIANKMNVNIDCLFFK